MGSFSIWHWIVVLVVVLAVFGTAKLRNIGGDLGTALKGFKDAMKDDEKKDADKVETVEHKADDTEAAPAAKDKNKDNA